MRSNALPQYRPDIDGLRAIAVLSVVAFHAFPDLMKGGFIGVDIFFVISGYLISTLLFENLERGTFSFTEFYSRRVKRIFPALLVVLSASYMAGWFTLLADQYKALGKHIAAGASFVSNIALWGESGYFDAPAETKPLLHLWSLGVEEQFYIVYPLLLWLGWKRKISPLTITGILAIISFCANVIGIETDAIATFYLPHTRFWELMCGGLLAWVTLYEKNCLTRLKAAFTAWPLTVDGSNLSNAASCSGAVLLAYGCWHIDRGMRFPGIWALVPVSGAILIIAAGKDAWFNKTVLSNRTAVWFGLTSYPLYLWHWPLLSFARVIEGEPPSVALRAAAVGLSIALAWLTYAIVERPIRSGRRSKLKVSALVLLMSTVFCIGSYTENTDGFEARPFNVLNKNVNQALSYDWKKGFRHRRCFLDALNERTSTFSDSCDSSGHNDRPLVLIWGDSYAASLYRGFLANTERFHFNLAQYTASGCPPVLDFAFSDRKECTRINDFVFDQLRRLHPSTVVMAGNWATYREGDRWVGLDVGKLEETIQKIKALGIKNLILIGQLPVYSVNQADMLRRRFSWDKVATRTYRNFDKSIFKQDEAVRSLAKRMGVNFISPLDLLCDEAGCLIATEEAPITPFAFDAGHLTEAGSQHLVSLFFFKNLIKF